MNLSAIVFCCASVPACIAYYLSRSSPKQVIWPRGAIVYSLGYSAAVGYLMALAATDLVKGIVSSSGLLGKVRLPSASRAWMPEACTGEHGCVA